MNYKILVMVALFTLFMPLSGSAQPNWCAVWIDAVEDASQIAPWSIPGSVGSVGQLMGDTSYQYFGARLRDSLPWSEFDTLVVSNTQDLLNLYRRIPFDIDGIAVKNGDTIRTCINSFLTIYDDKRHLGPKTEVKGSLFGSSICDGDVTFPVSGIPLLIRDAADLSFVDQTLTDADGDFSIFLDGGIYLIQPNPSARHWSNCSSVKQIEVDTQFLPTGPAIIPDAISLDAFGISLSDSSCADLKVEISTYALRPCFTTPYQLTYSNAGSATASNVTIDVMVDSLIHIDSTDADFEVIASGQLRFTIGDLGIGEGGSITLHTTLACDQDLVGRTFCMEAEIGGQGQCDENYRGAVLNVDGQCRGDSVFFRIENIGDAPTLGPVQYIVVEDVTSFAFEHDPLGPGEFFDLGFPATGVTYRVEVKQEPGNPRGAFDAATIEGCSDGTTSLSRGFHTMFAEPDQAAFISMHCRESTASFDPNDKTALPKGVGDANAIYPGTALEYQIRFQNTGTDTAFKVEIIDGMSSGLDPQTIQYGASSHPYTVEREGPMLRFIFENINLPDSNANEPASHGFVNYKVNPRDTFALGDTLHNKALIFFDFNEPIETNRTKHILVERKFSTTDLPEISQNDRQILLYPNPLHGLVLRFLGELPDPVEFTMYDAIGRFICNLPVEENKVELDASLPDGIYFYSIDLDGQKLQTGTLALNRE